MQIKTPKVINSIETFYKEIERVFKNKDESFVHIL
jgi:hypothetical protein